MYLVDTNVWLERLLEQERSEEVAQFLARTPPQRLFLTDFAFHSIGVICRRLDSDDVFLRFADDVLLNAGVGYVSLQPQDMEQVVSAAKEHSLDFDDAYQYVAAEKFGLTLVTFDSDFERPPLECLPPGSATPTE